ncbi:50S ribosomal protein L25 [Alphaproteobacteria bacterium endosymbiont of Tiliacea citrago]|uniref:50S ribosomal protein L25 n=1 Tax=Alphaproteobacteria bacterium endosymbiont of Tiliacea citrago TaxID=3077944 RepID=UPI00313CA8AB
MNLNDYELVIKERSDIGSKAARKLRSEGLIPATFYGQKEVFSGCLELKDLERAIRSKTLFNKFTNVDFNNSKRIVVAKVLQKDSVSEKILHIDFQIVVPSVEFKMRVPIVYKNAELCNDIKLGAILNIVKSTLVLKATPENMPDCLECDLSNAKAKTPIRLSSIEIPKNVLLVGSKSTDTIASISSLRKKASDSSSEASSSSSASAKTAAKK